MTTITVWLLVMFGGVHGGGLASVQPHLFPTVQACEQVAKNAAVPGRIQWRCIETQVVKP